jgi:4-hydroxy-3-polyprenylbenzoate decarboxylase
MAYRSLSHFIEELERMSELLRIAEPVATELEITEMANRQMKTPGGGKALLFERPTINGKISPFPLAINTMGSERRMARALGLESIDEIAHQMQLILKAKPPTSMREGWSLLKQGIDLLHARPKRVTDGPCKEVIHRFDKTDNFSLHDLPILLCWPKDGGRFITLPTVYTKDPDSGERNIGMYRMQVYDGRTTGMHWQIHKVGARHGKRYYERNEPMPVAVCLGGDPAYTFAATAPLPDGLDEVLFAGFARKKSVELVKCARRDLSVITPVFTRLSTGTRSFTSPP